MRRKIKLWGLRAQKLLVNLFLFYLSYVFMVFVTFVTKALAPNWVYVASNWLLVILGLVALFNLIFSKTK